MKNATGLGLELGLPARGVRADWGDYMLSDMEGLEIVEESHSVANYSRGDTTRENARITASKECLGLGVRALCSQTTGEG